MTESTNERMIDRWFPVAAVDEACGTPAGSGLNEKAIFTWFASRPIAQARAAALTVLLPYEERFKALIERAIRGDATAAQELFDKISNRSGASPTVLDIFSGRGIIPLEAGRAGARAIGIDLSPVATLAGRLLADYPNRDWSHEPPLPFGDSVDDDFSLDLDELGKVDRLSADVEIVLAEIDRRVRDAMRPWFPRNSFGDFPWGYIWATTIPCDNCKRQFPLIGSLGLRPPKPGSGEAGQSLFLRVESDTWRADVVDGEPTQEPTYSASLRGDGKKRKGKAGRCPFCGHVHPLETVKSKCLAGEQRDVLIAVADEIENVGRRFRVPTAAEIDAATPARQPNEEGVPYSSIPDELIPQGNVHTVMGSGYGYKTFGDLMVPRQAEVFAETARQIRAMHADLLTLGTSEMYARALSSYAASTLCRRLRRSTRGVFYAIARNGVSDVFTNEASINFSFDSFEAGIGEGAGTWNSVSKSTVRALRKVVRERRGEPVSLRRASATALPLRDRSVDVVICDPPYYDMIEYADASDLMYVWLKRALFDIEPDLFGSDVQESTGLQNKNDEIIVRRVHEPGRVRHDTDFYESMLSKAFDEARRVLKTDGHLVVIFGHSDPDAWRRLLGALQAAGFVVTSAWPSRTESGATGVASIRVTVSIGCRVAPTGRPLGIAAEVDRDVADAVAERIRQWDADGLALEDQLMASYGPAMEVYGRYSSVLNPDGTDADLDRYLTIARKAVRDAMRLRVDELPLETFDAITRFSVFWLRAKGRAEVPKGEARFFAQADELRLDDLRGRILIESKAGFRLTLDLPASISEQSSTFEVVRAMAHAWDNGGTEAVADVVALAGRESDDRHLWAVVAELANTLPSSDATAKALAGIKRTSSTISTLVGSLRESHEQASLFDEEG